MHRRCRADLPDLSRFLEDDGTEVAEDDSAGVADAGVADIEGEEAGASTRAPFTLRFGGTSPRRAQSESSAFVPR